MSEFMRGFQFYFNLGSMGAIAGVLAMIALFAAVFIVLAIVLTALEK